MLDKLNFLQSKYILLITFMVILSQPLSAAKSCDYRVFNIKTAEKVTSIELLTQIADSCDFSIIIKDTFASTRVEKELYGINIKNLSLDEIFEVLISDNDLYYQYDKNFLKISALKTKTFKLDYITSVRQGTANFNASVDSAPQEGGKKIISTDNTIESEDKFDFWSTILTEITAIMNTGAEEYLAKSPIVNSNAGLITVTGSKQQLERVEKYIAVLEKSLHKQVLIDVTILSVKMKNSKETGINWSKMQLELASSAKFNNKSKNAKEGSTHRFYADEDDTTNPDIGSSVATFANNKLSIVNDALFSMTGLINFLNTNGETKIISSPKVLTMNNQQSLITIGDNINYRLQTNRDEDENGKITITYSNYTIFIGVLLNITPEITDDNEIILRINPSVSDFKYSDDDKKQTSIRVIAPDTAEKKLSTVVKVKNGNTIILGGLITTNEIIEENNVPFLSDIPLLGRAFKHSGKTKITQELIFVITPRIIGPKDDTRATLKDLGFSKRIYDK